MSSPSSARAELVCGLMAIGLLGCQPSLDAGSWICADGDASVPEKTSPIDVPWSTGFENRFCDYTALAGFCYGDPGASYRTVPSPAHSGRHAAAFTVNSADPEAHQARCVRQGVLPQSAYYGAWYYIPVRTTNSGLWNLIHFQTTEPRPQPGLWDVSLMNGASGDLELVVYDFLNLRVRSPASPTPVPIGAWFHIQFYLERAADATGRVSLYQDGRLLLDVTNVLTDDSSAGQWYVGNLANGLSPADSTLYVDDVTISETL